LLGCSWLLSGLRLRNCGLHSLHVLLGHDVDWKVEAVVDHPLHLVLCINLAFWLVTTRTTSSHSAHWVHAASHSSKLLSLGRVIGAHKSNQQFIVHRPGLYLI